MRRCLRGRRSGSRVRRSGWRPAAAAQAADAASSAAAPSRPRRPPALERGNMAIGLRSADGTSVADRRDDRRPLRVGDLRGDGARRGRRDVQRDRRRPAGAHDARATSCAASLVASAVGHGERALRAHDGRAHATVQRARRRRGRRAGRPPASAIPAAVAARRVLCSAAPPSATARHARAASRCASRADGRVASAARLRRADELLGRRRRRRRSTSRATTCRSARRPRQRPRGRHRHGRRPSILKYVERFAATIGS